MVPISTANASSNSLSARSKVAPGEGRIERTPITSLSACSSKCMAFDSGRLSVNLPAVIRWRKAHAATPYSFSSSGKELAGCCSAASEWSGRRRKREARTPKIVSVSPIAARIPAIEIGRQPCLLHEFVKGGGALLVASFRPSRSAAAGSSNDPSPLQRRKTWRTSSGLQFSRYES